MSMAHPQPTSRGRLQRAVDEVLLAGLAALVAAVLQLGVARLADFPFSVYAWEWRSAALLWKTPWGYTILFAPLALTLALIALVLPRGVPLRFSLTAWLTLATWSVALLFPAIHGWASLVLALAVGLQLSRPLARREAALRVPLRRVGLAALLLTGVARPAFEWSIAGREQRAVASLPQAPTDAPNVLLIIWDTVRAASLSLHGASVPTTPRLDALAARGVTFSDAYATAPWTLPSHASMFTGLYASASHTDFAVPLPSGARTLAEVLRDRGFVTGAFTANLMATRKESGLGRGFLHFEDFTSSLHEIVHSTSITQADVFVVFLENLRRRRFWRVLRDLRSGGFETNFTVSSHDTKPAPVLARDFLAWQGGLPTGRPFFAFLNFFDAHDPYQPPDQYLRQVSGLNPTTIDRYHGGIRYIDEVMHEMLSTLAERGVLDNTIVVITSDHGEQFGEHGLTLHGNSLYRQALHVPLVMVFPPRLPAGVRVDTPVSLRDLPATLLTLAGSEPAREGIPGASLAALAGQPAGRASEVISELSRHYRRAPTLRNRNGPMESVVAGRWHLIRDGDGRLEAYDLLADGAEEHNRVASDAHADSLQGVLDAALTSSGVQGAAGYARTNSGTPLPRRNR